MSRAAEYMKKLRENRKKRGQCTRCGKPLPEGYENTQCNICRQEVREHDKRRRAEQPKKLFYTKGRIIQNQQLIQACIRAGMRAEDLASAVDRSTRTVQRWIYDGVEPLDTTVKADVNHVLGETVFDIEGREETWKHIIL